ncbi:hypothetical protein OAJ03_00090 [Candidatus Pelagibacter sp.]|nr:hypothetical protein [Candidatus Pelagibacter sp.]
MKKDLFNIDLDNSSKKHGSHSQKACEPYNSECKKINRKINGRKLGDINDKEVAHILSPFNT